LFSRAEVAALINRDFEAAWEMVRPVPVVRIDFGNGQVATRTLHGNIATYVCATDGQVVDILPGTYTPPVYMAALDQVRRLAVSLSPERERQTLLLNYHRERVQVLRRQPAQIVYPRVTVPQPGNPQAASAQPARVDPGKRAVELRVEQIVVQARAVPNGTDGARRLRPRPGQDLAEWELLAVDTWLNETQRRLLIHKRLAGEPVRPEQIKRWLYREVLHADLDDPYLGLGDALFGDDIFREIGA
jgi:hypothetical protein